MADHQPPRVVADETTTLLSCLQFNRESFLRKLTDLTEGQLLLSPVPTGTSLLGLLRHLVRVEQSWVLERFAGGPVSTDEPQRWDVDEATAHYRATWVAVDDVIRAHDLAALARADTIEPPVSLRWIVVHLIEETARHAGHADLVRELIDGVVGR